MDASFCSLLFLDDHDDQGQKKEENHNAGDEEREVSTLVGGIPILLDDAEDRIELVGKHVLQRLDALLW